MRASIHTQYIPSGKAPPETLEAYRKTVDVPPEATTKQVQVPGTISAFETQLPFVDRGGEPGVWLVVTAYGKVKSQSVIFIAPAATWDLWEPIARQMIASWQPSGLD